MKKLLVITTFAIAVSLVSSFGTGRIEIIGRPSYDENRDRQWRQSQLAHQRDDQRRTQWQRDRWQEEQLNRHRRHQRPQEYEIWLQLHLRDFDNLGR